MLEVGSILCIDPVSVNEKRKNHVLIHQNIYTSRKMEWRSVLCRLKYSLPSIILIFACCTFTMQFVFVQRVFPDDSRIENRYVSHSLVKFEYETASDSYAYNRKRFLVSINSWRRRTTSHPYPHCLVLIPPQVMYDAQSTDVLFDTVHAALSSKRAQVLLHVRTHDTGLISSIVSTFSNSIDDEQLILLTSGDNISLFDSNISTSNVQYGLEFAYMLDLAHQSGSNFSIVLWPGWTLNKLTVSSNSDYVVESLNHFQQIEETRKALNDFNRTCWIFLSDVETKRGNDVVFLDTAEHAFRMSLFLRSSLPYNRKTYQELLGIYCKDFLWSGNTIVGPSLFTYSTLNPNRTSQLITNSNAKMPFVDETNFDPPAWIDKSIRVGPRVGNAAPPYLIAFGVTAMIRPIVNTTYLEQFMDSLLQIVKTKFVLQSSENFEEDVRYSAQIVVLISGSTLDEIMQLRTFLETAYAIEIQRQMVKLVDSPFETILPILEKRRSTFNESSRRRYWRSKQNLDVAAVLQAASDESEYVMLLEDDTGFQPQFAEILISKLLKDKALSYSSADSWSQTDFGFGYSGILIRAMDVPVYKLLHQTFFDEIPCDLLGIWRVVRNGKRVYVYSPVTLRYKKRLYLKHLGKQSSLVGKTQDTW